MKVEQLKGQNKALTKKTHKQQLELQKIIEKIQLLQQDLKEMKQNLGVVLEEHEALVMEMWMLQ